VPTRICYIADILSITSAGVLVDFWFSHRFQLHSHLSTASHLATASQPFPVTLWLHLGLHIGPN